MRASFGTLDTKNQFFIRISLSLGTTGLKVVTNGRMFLDVFILFFKTPFHDEKLPLPLFSQLAFVGSLVRVDGIGLKNPFV